MSMPPPAYRIPKLAACCGFALALLLASSCMSLGERKNLANGYTELGNSFAEQKKWDKAGLAWSRALELDARQGIAGFNLMRALVEAKKYDEANARARAILKSDPENAMVLSMYAYSLYKSGENDKAAEIYEKVCLLNAQDALSLFNLAVLYEAAGKNEKAILKLRELVQLDPANQNARFRFGLLLLEQSDKASATLSEETLSEALINIELYLGAQPDSMPARVALARIHEKSGAFAKAIEAWVLVSQKAPADSLGWFNLARLRLVIAGDSANGLTDLKKALEMGFKDEAAINKLLASESLAAREEVLQLLADNKDAQEKALADKALEKKIDGD